MSPSYPLDGTLEIDQHKLFDFLGVRIFHRYNIDRKVLENVGTFK